MTALYSARWHRVAALKPLLGAQIRPRRLRVRGQPWVLLSDPASGRSLRLNASAYALVGRFDGSHSVQQLWDWQLGQQAGADTDSDSDTITQDEMIDLLAQLREAGLLQFDRSADFERLLPHLQGLERPRRRGSWLSWRLPLANPSRLLDRLQPVQRLLFSKPVLALWLLAMLMLVLLAVQHGPSLQAHAQRWLATPRFALLALLLYLPFKALHELAHGLAVRRWGGQVQEAGVTLMLLMPVPYVDASAANGFVQRHRRIIVSAAGIMTELSLAALALPLWLWLDDGLARDAAFVTVLMAGVSTLLFNANPLQRLDGYYIFCDAMDLPNLGPRSRQWWLDLLRLRWLRVPGAEPMAVACGETKWLALYAPLSLAMGVGIALMATLWLAQLSFALGLLSGLLLGWQMVLQPTLRLLKQLRTAALTAQVGRQRWRRVGLIGALLLVLLLALPLPQRMLVQGVIWPADQAQLRVAEDGFVTRLTLADGAAVQPGDLVLQLANPALQAAQQRSQLRVGALEGELINAAPGRPGAALDGRAAELRAELAAAQAELQRLDERVANLALRAQVAGQLALPASADLAGRYLKQGSLLGQVLGDLPPTVRVALPEAQATELLNRSSQQVSVSRATSPGRSQPATLLRESGGAVLHLPSAALSSRHGGAVQTDPQDKEDLTPLRPVLLLDVRLAHAEADEVARLGDRAWVRFDAGHAPLAWQLLHALRRELVLRLNPPF